MKEECDCTDVCMCSCENAFKCRSRFMREYLGLPPIEDKKTEEKGENDDESDSEA